MSINKNGGEGHGVCSWISETHKSRASALAAAPSGWAALTTPQNEYMDILSYSGSTMDITWITMRKRGEKEGQEAHECSKEAKKMFGLKAKLYHAQLHAEKIYTKKMHEKRNSQTEAC